MKTTGIIFHAALQALITVFLAYGFALVVSAYIFGGAI